MNEMTTAQERTPARSLVEIEAEIRAQKNIIGQGFVAIGQALIEAKEQLNHGEWGEWLRTKVNFSQGTADNYMRLAREYGNGSALPTSSYTKALALLAVPAEEREAFAEANDIEDKSVSEIKRLIRERDEAKQWGREQMERADKLYKRVETAEAQIKTERRHQDRLTVMLNKERENVAKLLKREPDTVTIEKEVPPKDYEELQLKVQHLERQADTLARRAAMAEDERDEAQETLLAATEEIDALRQMQETPDPLDLIPFSEACTAFLNALYAAPYAEEFFRTCDDDELRRYAVLTGSVLNWANGVSAILDIIRAERTPEDVCFEII